MTLGVPDRAAEVLAKAKAAANDEEGVATALAAVAYYRGGPAALQAQLSADRLDAATGYKTLLQAAYYKLLAGDAPAAKLLAKRATLATDYTAADLENPWDISRWGHSENLTLALIEMRTGSEAQAARRLTSISSVLDKLVSNGEKRFGVDEVRAAVLTLSGDGDAAMRSLTRAAELGWRRSWWAQREPDLADLWTRNDFRALVARVDQSNSDLRARFVQAAR